jgi:hypothetical protein
MFFHEFLDPVSSFDRSPAPTTYQRLPREEANGSQTQLTYLFSFLSFLGSSPHPESWGSERSESVIRESGMTDTKSKAVQ